MQSDPRNESVAVKIILWWISQLVLGRNNCCAAILSIFFESLLLLTLQKDKMAIQYVVLKSSTVFQCLHLFRGSVPNYKLGRKQKRQSP